MASREKSIFLKKKLKPLRYWGVLVVPNLVANQNITTENLRSRLPTDPWRFAPSVHAAKGRAVI
jgi:hypothetical protein